jgi:hypothetical protein
MEANVEGHQRKIVSSEVRPRRLAHGTAGIPLRDGKTLPFRVVRRWNAPAGNYEERFYLVHPETREVLYEGSARMVLIWGLQSLTEVVDEIAEPLPLAPGTYLAVFALGGIMGGQLEVPAAEVSSTEAA